MANIHPSQKKKIIPDIRYWGKKPPSIIQEFIREHTSQGDVVLDPFGGSGNTIATALSLQRRGIYVDLNPFAKLIAEARIVKCPLEDFQKNKSKILEQKVKIKDKTGKRKVNPKSLFLAKCPCGEWKEYSSVVKSRIYRTKKPIDTDITALRSSIYEKVEEADEICYESLIEKFPNKRSHVISRAITWLKNEKLLDEKVTPVLLVFREKCSCGRKKINLKENDTRHIEWMLEGVQPSCWFPTDKLQYSDGKDFLKQRDFQKIDGFINDRSLAYLSHVWDKISKLEVSQKVDKALKFVFMNTLCRSSNMCRESGGTWPVNSYWVPRRFKIKNPRHVFRRALREMEKSIKNSQNQLEKGSVSEVLDKKTTASFLQGDAKNLPIPDNSIEYVITDPPHLGEAQFLELSLLYNGWLRKRGDFEKELTVNSKQEKSMKDYLKMFGRFTEELGRILKEDGTLTIILQVDKQEIQEKCIRILNKSNFILENKERNDNFTFYTFKVSENREN
ncbi:hypothetical protein AKJ52_00970 [candidate division MSBL1 archaeon SCGC-AAA382C18]|uniref:DNA methylase N-4/N-6 domain-containing protein n=1 Tax=candidate division MSBL1 archaeon SCGC-AAA382C18 TaxID=1698281 RepID=A0A133VL10_9EURY|nr:hypothetical protein AKJ52_00970 [candidate division MSBL1 archaeon SCGC-AAA382C18]